MSSFRVHRVLCQLPLAQQSPSHHMCHQHVLPHLQTPLLAPIKGRSCKTHLMLLWYPSPLGNEVFTAACKVSLDARSLISNPTNAQCQAKDMPWHTAVPKMWPAFLECTTSRARGSIRYPLLLTALPPLLDNSDSNPTPRATLGSVHRDGHEYCTCPACVMPWSPFPALGASSLSLWCPPERGFELKLCSAPDQATLIMPKASPAQPWRR